VANNTRGAATTGKMRVEDVAIGPERTPTAAPIAKILAAGESAQVGDLVTFRRFTPLDGGTEVENGNGKVLSAEDRGLTRGIWIETGKRPRKKGGDLPAAAAAAAAAATATAAAAATATTTAAATATATAGAGAAAGANRSGEKGGDTAGGDRSFMRAGQLTLVDDAKGAPAPQVVEEAPADPRRLRERRRLCMRNSIL
jgi:hypothetical protein